MLNFIKSGWILNHKLLPSEMLSLMDELSLKHNEAFFNYIKIMYWKLESLCKKENYENVDFHSCTFFSKNIL